MNKAESLRNEISVSGSVLENVLSYHKSEVDNNESNYDYQTKVVHKQLNEQTITESIDFNILLTDPSLGITEFHRSFFTICLNFRIYMLSMGMYTRIGVESDCLLESLYHFGVDLAKTNTK
jgi:hypothetical protein